MLQNVKQISLKYINVAWAQSCNDDMIIEIPS